MSPAVNAKQFNATLRPSSEPHRTAATVPRATNRTRKRTLSAVLPIAGPRPPPAIPPFRLDTFQPLRDEATIDIRLAHGVASARGTRPTMEDAHAIYHPLVVPSDPGASVGFYGVFDGHGGDAVAHAAAKHLASVVAAHPECLSAPPRALVSSFIQFDRDLHTATRAGQAGSTAVVALVIDSTLYIANLGDARAVVVEGTPSSVDRVLALSEDHRPSLPGERARVEESGSFILGGRLGGFLAVSRAFGDFGFKAGLHEDGAVLAVSNIPDISTYSIGDCSRAVVIACDGLWDVVPNHFVGEVVSAVLAGAPPSRAAQATWRRMKELHYPLGVVRTEVASLIGGIHSRSQKPCDKAAAALIELAFMCDTRDNVSVVVISLH